MCTWFILYKQMIHVFQKSHKGDKWLVCQIKWFINVKTFSGQWMNEIWFVILSVSVSRNGVHVPLYTCGHSDVCYPKCMITGEYKSSCFHKLSRCSSQERTNLLRVTSGYHVFQAAAWVWKEALKGRPWKGKWGTTLNSALKAHNLWSQCFF